MLGVLKLTDPNTEHVPKNESKSVPLHLTPHLVACNHGPSKCEASPPEKNQHLDVWWLDAAVQLGTACPNRASEGLVLRFGLRYVTSLGASAPAPPSTPNLMAVTIHVAGLD